MIHLCSLHGINQVGYVYDKVSFSLQRSFDVQGEGWGLTYDGQNLIMSNGSSTLDSPKPADLPSC